MAPEIKSDGSYGHKVDVYSFGKIVQKYWDIAKHPEKVV
jgi:hypothetical protein